MENKVSGGEKKSNSAVYLWMQNETEQEFEVEIQIILWSTP